MRKLKREKAEVEKGKDDFQISDLINGVDVNVLQYDEEWKKEEY